MSDPSIPAALAPAVAGIVSLNDFRPHPMYRRRTDFTTSSGYQLMVPADLATIYNFNPLFAAGYSGTGTDHRHGRGYQSLHHCRLDDVPQCPGS